MRVTETQCGLDKIRDTPRLEHPARLEHTINKRARWPLAADNRALESVKQPEEDRTPNGHTMRSYLQSCTRNTIWSYSELFGAKFEAEHRRWSFKEAIRTDRGRSGGRGGGALEKIGQSIALNAEN